MRHSPTRFPSRHGLVLLAVASTVAGCRFPFPTASRGGGTPQPVPAAATGAVLPGPIREAVAAEALYANGGGLEGMARWRPKRLWQTGGPKFEAATEFDVIGENVIPFEEDGKVRAFAVVTIRPTGYTCPRCAPIVGAVALTDAPGGWMVDAAEPELTVWGGKGVLTGSTSLVRLASDRHGFALQSGTEVDGLLESSLLLVAERGGQLVEVLRIGEAAGGNKGSCGAAAGETPCWGWDSDWSTTMRKGAELWDFKIVMSGTRPNESTKTPEEFSETRTYSWNGSGYQLAAGGSDDAR